MTNKTYDELWSATDPEFWNSTSWRLLVGILLFKDDGYGSEITDDHQKLARLHIEFAILYWRAKKGSKPVLLMSTRDRQIWKHVELAESILKRIDGGESIPMDWLQRETKNLPYYENKFAPDSFSMKG